ncbi:MAG: hypothetical protein ACTHYC_14660 [Sphingobacterium sp.]
MHTKLKEKLWAYIVQNNPDLMHRLQDEYHVVKYLEEKVSAVMPKALKLLEKNIPGYAIIEICLNEMTAELKPSRYKFILGILKVHFPEIFQTYEEQGQLAYEGVKLVEYCQSTFEAVRFQMDDEQDIQMRSVIKTKIATYLDSNKSNHES